MENILGDSQSRLGVWKASPRVFLDLNYERQWKAFICALTVLDTLVIATSLTLAFKLRISSGILTYSAYYEESTYTVLTALSVVVWLVLFAAFGLYRRDNLLGGNLEYQQAIKACTAGIVVLIVLSFTTRDVAVVSRIWLLLSWGLSVAFMVAQRFIARRVAYALRRRGWFTARVLIVGANDQGVAIAEQWRNSQTSGMEVVGFADDFKPTGMVVLDGLKVVGHPTALADLVQATAASEVIIVPNAVAWETFEEIVTQNIKSKNYKLRLSPGFYGLLTTSVAVTNKSFVPLFTINEARIVGVDAYLKSLLDYCLGAILLAFTLPLQVLIALLLKLRRWSEPVLTRYRAVGQGGALFTMLKFNTLANTSRDGEHGDADWLGRFIYSKGLDKLPQLLNVLSGHMSLVGPRPTVLDSDSVDLRVAYSVHAVKPGVLGPWLVREFWSSDESQDELYYVRNWTIWLDLQFLTQALLSWLRISRTAPEPHQRSHKTE